MRARQVWVMAAVVCCAAASCRKPAAAPREFTNSVGMKFVWIEPGSFQMGSETGLPYERPVREVTLSKGFYLQVTEVTQAQWEAVMGSNPSHFRRPDNPVEHVSWLDVQEFLVRLNEKEKDTGDRLPTEAEWEYACRAGGQEPDRASDLDAVAWWLENSGFRTHPVARKKPNAWGLFDMRGNVWEWVQDWYGPYPARPQTDPKGPLSGEFRVVRGGSWLNRDTGTFRCADRYYHLRPDARYDYHGFRCARTH